MMSSDNNSRQDFLQPLQIGRNSLAGKSSIWIIEEKIAKKLEKFQQPSETERYFRRLVSLKRNRSRY
jgi:hypothetical protein